MGKDRIKILIALVACLLVFTLAFFFVSEGTKKENGVTAGSVVISEILSGNTLYPDDNGAYLDFIEIHNPNTYQVNLSGYKLSDKETAVGYTFSGDAVIPAGGYTVVFCNKEDRSGAYAGFGISAKGDEAVYLYNSANVLIDRVQVSVTEKNVPLIRGADGNWTEGSFATPGYPNTQEGFQQWLASKGEGDCTVRINEVQTSNRSSVLGGNGQFCDWIELYNYGSEPQTLTGFYLSNEEGNPLKWALPELVLQPGAYQVIACAGDSAEADEAPFGLSKSGCTVTLSGLYGNELSKVVCPAMAADVAYQCVENGEFLLSKEVSPGYPNTQEGAKRYRDTCTVRGCLAINEVMPSNSRYMLQNDGNYYDWVELKNVSDRPINLADYALSDQEDNLHLFPLPERTLQPGEKIVVICSGNTALTGNYIHAPFGLNYQQCWVYVTHLEEGLSDGYRVENVPSGGSMGRKDGETELYYFKTPTPKEENKGGQAQIADTPFVETPAGVYNNVQGVEVVLSGEGQIRYTLDGSVPTVNSPLYTTPLYLTSTTTVRAISFAEGKLPSKTLTAGYIINEQHEFPVLSISADPNSIFGGGGIYTNYNSEAEVPCNVSFYEDGNGFSIDCGIKMHGHTGLMNPKKSFKINFRSRYGEKYLTYPVYGEDAPQVYDSLCIRAGQDYLFAFFREELFVSLCQDMTDEVLTQRSRYCVVYINGQYFGIYNLKEAFTELYYAHNRDVSEESVEILQAPVYPNTEVYGLMAYMRTHDLSVQEHYEYVSSKLDIESIIDWMIIEAYCTNGDVQQNLRYFRSSENGYRYEPALYDLDWAFYYHNPFGTLLDPNTEWQHVRLLRPLFENAEFREQFFSRLSYHLEHTLSTENVLKRIDELETTLLNEMYREKSRWGGTVGIWKARVQELRSFITNHNHPAQMVYRLQRYVWLSSEETQKYFGRWVQ